MKKGEAKWKKKIEDAECSKEEWPLIKLNQIILLLVCGAKLFKHVTSRLFLFLFFHLIFVFFNLFTKIDLIKRIIGLGHNS